MRGLAAHTARMRRGSRWQAGLTQRRAQPLASSGNKE